MSNAKVHAHVEIQTHVSVANPAVCLHFAHSPLSIVTVAEIKNRLKSAIVAGTDPNRLQDSVKLFGSIAEDVLKKNQK